jgi:hypothetical protein
MEHTDKRGFILMSTHREASDVINVMHGRWTE